MTGSITNSVPKQKQQAALKTLSENPVLKAILPLVDDFGATLYPVGGCVRDALMGKLPENEVPDDLDCMVISPDAQALLAALLAAAIAKRFNGALVPLDPEFGIYRVVLHAGTNVAGHTLEKRVFLDVSDALGNSLETDLARRDLTINAMALDLKPEALKTSELIDCFNGASDLAENRIRMVSEANLLEDPLRMLRVFRFAAALESATKTVVTIDAETLAVVKAHAHKINAVAAERIQEELYKFFSADVCFPSLLKLTDMGLLETIFPEMTPMRAIPPNGHHHLGLFEHTLELVKQAERFILELPEPEQRYFHAAFTENASVTRFGLVKLACLFHDLGKPDTMAVKPTESGERFTYYGHDQVSADYTEKICKRLKTGNAVKEHLMHLTRWHLYPCQFGKTSPRKSVLRFYRRLAEVTPDVILLALADRFSTLGPDVTGDILRREHENLLWLLENYRVEMANLKQPLLLNGRDVMQALDMPPGPKLKDILSALEEAQQLGEVTSKDAALAWLKRVF